jgi:hypothetical protein
LYRTSQDKKEKPTNCLDTIKIAFFVEDFTEKAKREANKVFTGPKKDLLFHAVDCVQL